MFGCQAQRTIVSNCILKDNNTGTFMKVRYVSVVERARNGQKHSRRYELYIHSSACRASVPYALPRS